jgi:hypothetical protein
MTKQAFEQYQFIRLWEHDLNLAIYTLKTLKRYKKDDVRNALLRDIIVTYARPFSVNKGKEIKKHKLSLKFVPKQKRKLHDELIDLRNQLFAHTDLPFKNPKVGKWDFGHYKMFPMSFKGFDYKKVHRKIEEITNLINEVHLNLVTEIKDIEKNL